MSTPTVEVGYDTYDDACLWNMRLHEGTRILEPSWPWYEKLKARNPRICVIEHRWTGNLVVGAWVYAPGEATVPVVQELMTFQGSGDGWQADGLPVWRVLQNMLKPAEEKLSELEARRKADARRRRDQAQLNHDSKEETKKYYRRHGMAHEARMLDYSPWHVPLDDTYDQAQASAKFVKEFI